ncbi:efflux RND transporter periplasmic adaptor subunit [Hahella ganghwensis]|uniref:efflux RND transporter periplasmic adaptor subunit n=1 Tax=Hahella ganghwensis TaxID=286420 RepID=UPI00036916A6|nr:efflux RND transporter periplasmic adaptor subunit [Hahella ganghwensis]
MNALKDLDIHWKLFALWLLLFAPVFIANAQEAPVYTETVTVEKVQREIDTSGLLVNPSEQSLAFKTPGIVSSIYVREGQSVRKGEVLAELDKEEIEAQLEQAQSLHLDAERTLERVQKLYKSKVVSLDQLQSAETGLEVANSKLRIARFNYKHATIKAPGNGRILRKLIEPNEQVNAQVRAFIFANDDAGWVIRVGLNDRDIVRIKEGDLARIKVDAYPEQVFEGSVYETAAKASNGTGTFEVEIRVNPSTTRLLSGMVSRVTLTPSDYEELVLIPLSAIISATGSSAEVFTLDSQNRAHLTSVIMRDFSHSHVATLSGLKAGDTIVTRGATGVVEGRKVLPVGEIASLQ